MPQHSRDIHISRLLCEFDIEAVICIPKSFGRSHYPPIVDLTISADRFAPGCVRDRFHPIDVDPEENQIKGYVADVVVLIVVDASVLIVQGKALQEKHYNAHKLQTHLIIYYKYFKEQPPYHLLSQK